MKAIITLFLISLTIPAFSQDKNSGAIQGKITDGKTGETIPFADVELLQNGSKVQSDLEGVYKFGKLPQGKYSVKVVYTEYPSITVTDIDVVNNTVTIIDISLNDTVASAIDGEVVITARRNRESVNDLYLKQKQAPNFSDGIPAEVIKRSPDKTAGDALKRISGASIQDNKFAIIRGLNDRYNAAYLNGGPLPSSESDRKAFSFDIFPANMLDNIVISKTATPDQPAEFAGGIISINTKSIPDKKFYSVSMGTGYNTITTFKDQQTYKGGKTDWLGLDDGTRKLSPEIPSAADFPLAISEQAALAQRFSTNWSLVDKKFSPNYNLQFAMGFNPKIKGRELGIISSITYNRTFNYNETTRRSYANSITPGVPSQRETDYLDKNNSEQVLAGALVNLSFKINENNSIGFKNIYSINSDDRLINRTGEIGPMEADPVLIRSNARWFTSNNIYSGQLNGEHLLKTSKLRIDWLVSFSNVKRTIPSLQRSIYTRYKYLTDPSNPNPYDTIWTANIASSNVGPSYGGGMFFSENNENSVSARLDVTYPTNLFGKIKSDFKAGGMGQIRNREFTARQLGYTKYGVVGGNIDFKQDLLYLPEDEIFAPENMGLLQAPSGGSNGVGGFKLYDGTKNSDAYDARSDLYAGYLMLDNRFKNDMRLVWGVRTEFFNQQLTALRDDKSELKLNTKKLDILPSLNYIWSITKKQNLRFSYSQTLNRPEYRELAPFAFFDFNTNFVVSGNDSLLRASIQNLDLRYEFFPGRGQILSGTVFYKHFTNPIEQISRADVTNEVSYKNVPTAQNYGLEIEARSLVSSLINADTSSFFEQLTVYTNLSIIRSMVDVSNVLGSADDTRPLQGQSPYVFNAGIYYNNVRHNWGMTLSLNKVGPRIAIVGNINEPDLWENSRTFLDFQVSKTFWKNKAEFKLNASNLLAQKQEFYQNTIGSETTSGVSGLFNTIFVGDKNNRTGLDSENDDVVWSTVFGRTFSASLSIRF
ncbi:MAG TPA: outer membrane beta-barrel protein [Fluviicola sp.]|nr:outer membrane beta-barrel protein [Fluviicola sp.]